MEIVLRPAEVSDIPALFSMYSDPLARTMAAFGEDDPDDPVAFAARWDRLLGDPEITVRAIIVDGHVVGSVALWFEDGVAQLGYWVDRDHWGKGVATTAVRELLGACPRPVQARVAFDNHGSQTVLTRLGFRVTGTERSYARAREADIEEFVYELT